MYDRARGPPHPPTPIDPNATLARIRDLQDAIAQAPEHSPGDVAVKLRRLAARLDGSDPLAWQLVTSALEGVEESAVNLEPACPQEAR